MKESPPWNIFLASPAQRQEACCYINSLDLGGNILSPHSARYPGAVKGISADVPLRNDLKAFCKWEIPPALDETEGNNLITKEEKQGQTKCQITYRKLAAGKNRVQLKPLVLRVYVHPQVYVWPPTVPRGVPGMQQYMVLELVEPMTHPEAC